MPVNSNRSLNTVLGKESEPTCFVRTQLSSALGTLFEVPENRIAEVNTITLANNSVAVDFVRLYFVGAGTDEVADDSNIYLPEITVTEKEIKIFNTFTVLDSGGTIQAQCGNDNSITIHIDGFLIG